MKKVLCGYHVYYGSMDYFVECGQTRRTEKLAKIIMEKCLQARYGYSIDCNDYQYIKSAMQFGTCELGYSEKWKKHTYKITTENGGVYGFIEDNDCIIIEDGESHVQL